MFLRYLILAASGFLILLFTNCARDLLQLPNLSIEVKRLGADSLWVRSAFENVGQGLSVQEMGVLWSYTDPALKIGKPGVLKLPVNDSALTGFETVLGDLPFDTVLYVRSFLAVEENGGKYYVYSPVVTHSTGIGIKLLSVYRVVDDQVTVVTKVSGLPENEHIDHLDYVWVNLDSMPNASLSAPHDSLSTGEITAPGTYEQVIARLKPATSYLLRAQAMHRGRAIYGNTMDAFIGDVWQQMKNFTAAGDRWAPLAFTIGNRGFVGFGEALTSSQQPFGGTAKYDLWMYDQAQDTWTRMRDFPGKGRFWATTFVINGKAYVGGGTNSAPSANQQFNDFYTYSPSLNEWDTVAPLPITVRSATGFSLQGKGYLCGGVSSTYAGAGQPVNLNTLFEFDPTQNNGKGAWRQLASFPGPGRKNLVSFVLNGKAYVGCGKDGVIDEDINDGQSYNDFYCFDPLAGPLGGWTVIDPFPGGGRYDALAFSIGEYGFVGAGANRPYPTFKDLWCYKPGEGWKRKADIGSLNRRSSFAFVVDNQAFIGLGMLMSFVATIDNDVWRYTAER